MIEQNSLLAVHLIFHKCCEFYGLGLLDELVRVVVFCVYCSLLNVILCCAGERPENPQDLLQEVQEAPAPQSYPVQEGEGFSLCTG